MSFDDFCNFILPYRIKNESIEDWRRHLSDSFLVAHDYFVSEKGINIAVDTMFQTLHKPRKKFELLWLSTDVGIPDLAPTVIEKLPLGSCSNLVGVTISAMRSVSIPEARDFTPNYLNISVGHDWTSLLIDSSRVLPLDITSDSVGIYKLDIYTFSKVYRESFKPVNGNHLSKVGYCSYLLDLFNNPFLEDVTSSYGIISNLEIPLYNIPRKIKIAYLLVYRRPNWGPIAFGTIKNKKLYCNNLARGGVYLPAAIDENGSAVIGRAMILERNGTVRFLAPDLKNLNDVKLYRKFPILYRDWPKEMVGGKFQGANRSDFYNTVDLFEITESPGMNYNTIEFQNLNKFRYARYPSPKMSNGNIAELEFFESKEDENSLNGKIISSLKTKSGNLLKTPEAVFDKKELTYFESDVADLNWVGLDFGTKRSISKIRYLARNDKNNIFPGFEYELLYWDDQWKSLGTVVSDTTQYLIYKNVPGNSLLWLRNLSEGWEERIFTYENGKQVWW